MKDKEDEKGTKDKEEESEQQNDTDTGNEAVFTKEKLRNIFYAYAGKTKTPTIILLKELPENAPNALVPTEDTEMPYRLFTGLRQPVPWFQLIKAEKKQKVQDIIDLGHLPGAQQQQVKNLKGEEFLEINVESFS